MLLMDIITFDMTERHKKAIDIFGIFFAWSAGIYGTILFGLGFYYTKIDIDR